MRHRIPGVCPPPLIGDVTAQLHPLCGRDARPSPRATNQLAAGARTLRVANQRGGRGAGRAGPGRGRAACHAASPSQRGAQPASSSSSGLGDPRQSQCSCGAVTSDSGEVRPPPALLTPHLVLVPAPIVPDGGSTGWAPTSLSRLE
jgi:hypothetical protein